MPLAGPVGRLVIQRGGAPSGAAAKARGLLAISRAPASAPRSPWVYPAAFAGPQAAPASRMEATAEGVLPRWAAGPVPLLHELECQSSR